MKRVYVNLTDEQLAGLKARSKRSGAPIAEEIRRAVALSLTSEGECAQREIERTQALLEWYRRNVPAKTEQAPDAILTREQAERIAQKLGKPFDELYEPVLVSAEQPLFSEQKASA